MVKVDPFPSSLTTSIVAPWFSKILAVIESPRPVPSDFVVKKGSKIFFR
jgi:hypothetical protein